MLLQGYPDLEYIIIDGGSTDETLQVIRKYARWLASWVSEPDSGQSQAINKGFRKASGSIVSWLCSDDTLEPGTLHRVAAEINHELGRHVVNGGALVTDATGRVIRSLPATRYDLARIQRHWVPYSAPPQPAVFHCRHVLDEVGLLDETLHYTMDYDLWCRIASRFIFHPVDQVFARCRIHPESKSGKGFGPFLKSLRSVSRRYWGPKTSLAYWWLDFQERFALALLPLKVAYHRIHPVDQ